MLPALHAHWRALNLDLHHLPHYPTPTLATIFAAHALGIAAVTQLAHWPPWWLGGLVALATLAMLQRREARPELLLPLLVLYTLAALRLALSLTVGLPPELGQALSYTRALVTLVLPWMLALLLTWWIPPTRRLTVLAAALGLGGVLWVAVLYPRLIPAGVTGADPYAYVQMAIDLRSSGSLLHDFPLAQIPYDLGLPVYPALHVGYNPHLTPGGQAASVWPPGYAVLLAGIAAVFGEGGMLAANARLAVLSLLATYWLARAVLPERGDAPVIGALAALLLLTSAEQAVRQAVPLADIAAQLFTTLALILALRQDNPSNRWATGVLLAGMVYGAAYAIRYTQVLLAPAFLFLFWRRWRLLVTFFAGAALVALPDLMYHASVFGSPLATGSSELQHFALGNVIPVLVRVGGDWLNDWGLLAPLIALGGWQLWRTNRRAAIVLGLGLGTVTLFHLFYWYLKLRDVLWLWPTLTVLAALGLGTLRRWPGLAFGLALILIGGRWWGQLPLTAGFYTSGFLDAEQRANVAHIADLTPPDAVIAASLNSGAVELYAGRDTLRPGRVLQPGDVWAGEEWLAVVAVLFEQGRPLYLLADSVEMDGPLAVLRTRYTVTEVTQLYLPFYLHGGGAENRAVVLYAVVADD